MIFEDDSCETSRGAQIRVLYQAQPAGRWAVLKVSSPSGSQVVEFSMSLRQLRRFARVMLLVADDMEEADRADLARGGES